MSDFVGRLWRAVACLAALGAALQVMAADTLPGTVREQHVLVLYSYSRLLPAIIEADLGLRESLSAAQGRRVTIHDEFLDLPSFGGQNYDQLMVGYLKGKHGAQPPDAILVAGAEALRFVLQHREALFPAVPVVHEGIYLVSMPMLPPLPPDVVGVPLDPDLPRTIEWALRVHAGIKKVVLVTGAAPGLDREWGVGLRADLKRFEGRVAIEFLAGLPHEQVLARLQTLGKDTVVYTPGYFQDGAGRDFLPVDAVRDMAAVSQGPIYGPGDTLIGTGVVGGYTRTYRSVGREAGEIIIDLLEGASAASMDKRIPVPSVLYLDWRQVERWGIDNGAIPGDAVIAFRSPTIWETYRSQVLVSLVIVLLQAALIFGLLTERYRRLRAERAVEKQRFELAHASRLAVAGELTAAIAHEINQPLGAILSNADTAELLLQSGADRSSELREILADIRRDDLRASEVIRRLRTLLSRHEVERHLLDVNAVAADALAAVRSEATRRGVALEVRPAPEPASTLGDPIQMQQVLINLLLNAMDAITDMPAERRTIALSVECQPGFILLAVSDRGHGIAAEHLPRLFDSFFSTKRQGMGLGLSIVRSLIEAQNGRVWAENIPTGGAVFYVELRRADESVAETEGSTAETPLLDST